MESNTCHGRTGTRSSNNQKCVSVSPGAMATAGVCRRLDGTAAGRQRFDGGQRSREAAKADV